MAEVIIALGSNLGNRHQTLVDAATFLDSISTKPIVKSSIWESEPLGPAKYPFLNSAVKLETFLSPTELLKNLKKYEKDCGRNPEAKRWSPRILDLDIIFYGNLAINKDTLIIPHPEYVNRAFVILPVCEIDENIIDPITGIALKKLATTTNRQDIKKTDLSW